MNERIYVKDLRGTACIWLCSGSQYGAQIVIDTGGASIAIRSLTADHCDQIADLLRCEAARMRRAAADDARVIAAIAEDEMT